MPPPAPAPPGLAEPPESPRLEHPSPPELPPLPPGPPTAEFDSNVLLRSCALPPLKRAPPCALPPSPPGPPAVPGCVLWQRPNESKTTEALTPLLPALPSRPRTEFSDNTLLLTVRVPQL